MEPTRPIVSLWHSIMLRLIAVIYNLCDSLAGNTADSLMQLFYEPVVWSETNQIVAEQMDLYIYNGELDYAHFMGDPIMSSQVLPTDTVHYNQIRVRICMPTLGIMRLCATM